MTSSTAAHDDEHYMRLALAAARRSADQGEVPVGAVLVGPRQSGDMPAALLACTHNQPIGRHDPTAHAEVLALREAARQLSNYRLDGCDVYVTLEPCAMCAQAMLHARVRRVIYGAREPRTGAAGSVLDLFAFGALNHHTEVVGGVLADECSALMQQFFAGRRLAAKRAATPLRQDALRTPDTRFDAARAAYPVPSSASRNDAGLAVLQGLRLHYLDSGPGSTGTTWLVIHGPDGWWPQLATWYACRAHAGDRVLLPDLIGFGQSDKPKKTDWHTVDSHAEVLLELLAARGIADFSLAHAPGQQALVERLLQRCKARVQVIQELSGSDLDPLAPSLADAPYPDAGYLAARRAWIAQGWWKNPARKPRRAGPAHG